MYLLVIDSSIYLRMASNVFGAKQFKPSAPDKGSFPLDHHGECKAFYLEFMICMNEKGRRIILVFWFNITINIS